MDETYLTSIIYFVNLLKDHQKNNKWTFELGRKYDKIINTEGIQSVRYFVERSTGNIYGARSNTTPNLAWYFGNLNRCHLWDWNNFHGVPTSDPGIRAVSHYGPYIRYIEE
jgi:hypothetical protein